MRSIQLCQPKCEKVLPVNFPPSGWNSGGRSGGGDEKFGRLKDNILQLTNAHMLSDFIFLFILEEQEYIDYKWNPNN